MIDSSDDSYFFLKFSNYLDLIIFTLPKAWYPHITFSSTY
jgi:hypothetical protein